jgi:hypothetical protein
MKMQRFNGRLQRMSEAIEEELLTRIAAVS